MPLMKLWRPVLSVLLTLVGAACASSPTATFTPTPPPTPTATPAQAVQVTCGGGPGFCERLAEEALTAVIGRVLFPAGEEQASERIDSEDGVIYRDWSVEIERYVRHPQPFQRIQVRVFIAEVLRPTGPHPSVPIPMKTARLEQGERVLLLLNKSEPYNTRLGEEQFSIVGPCAATEGVVSGKFELQGGMARPFRFSPYPPPWEPLDEIIAAIETSAQP